MSRNFGMQVLIIEDTVGDYLDGAFNYTDREIKALISKARIYHIKKSNISDEKFSEIKRMSFCFLTLEGDLYEQIKKVNPYIACDEVKSGENKYAILRKKYFITLNTILI